MARGEGCSDANAASGSTALTVGQTRETDLRPVGDSLLSAPALLDHAISMSYLNSDYW